MLGCLTLIASLATAVAAGLGYFSFWWTIIPAFFAGALVLSNGPGYQAIMQANERGNLWLFPLQLLIHIGGVLLASGLAFWLTGWFS